MAGSSSRTGHQPRRFITRHDVEDAKASGAAIQLTGRDVLTDEAAQRAMDLGVRIERAQQRAAAAPAARPAAATSSASGGTTAPRVRAGVSGTELRAAVRAAVVAELGTTPPGLDAVIDRVLAKRDAGSTRP